MSAMSPHSKRERRRSSISGNVFRRAVAREDDLLARLVEVVERVEELFLRALLARDELDVVDQEQVDRAIARAELRRAVEANRVDELVGEALRREIDDGQAREELGGLVADGVQQVRLAEPDAAVDEQRVVGARRQLGHGLRRRPARTGSTIRRRRCRTCSAGSALRRSAAPRGTGSVPPAVASGDEFRGQRIVDDDRDARMPADALRGGRLEHVEMVLDQPVPREPVGRRDREVVALERRAAGRGAARSRERRPGSLRAEASKRRVHRPVNTGAAPSYAQTYPQLWIAWAPCAAGDIRAGYRARIGKTPLRSVKWRAQ